MGNLRVKYSINFKGWYIPFPPFSLLSCPFSSWVAPGYQETCVGCTYTRIQALDVLDARIHTEAHAHAQLAKQG